MAWRRWWLSSSYSYEPVEREVHGGDDGQAKPLLLDLFVGGGGHREDGGQAVPLLLDL
jgi:hypothetical protein